MICPYANLAEILKRDTMITCRNNLKTNYGTHQAPLMTVIANTQGPVLELGCGDFSTPLLHALCAPSKRFLMSAETNKSWMRFFVDLSREWHLFRWVETPKDWDTVGDNIHWSVVFVDHEPVLRRIEDIKRLRNKADIFVVHDLHLSGPYNYEPYLSTFTYRYDYNRYWVATAVVSDTVDVKKFFED